MDYQAYKSATVREFAYFGFSACPLTEDEIVKLHQMGASVGQAYEIGCDIAAGVDADRAFDLELSDCQ